MSFVLHRFDKCANFVVVDASLTHMAVFVAVCHVVLAGRSQHFVATLFRDVFC